MHQTAFLALGGLLAALAVGLGAIGAHALKSFLQPQQLDTFHTAVHYQLIHAIGLVLVGLLLANRPSRLWQWGGWLMVAGILLFSGFLLAWLATGNRLFVYAVPIGGAAMILAWLAVAAGALGVGRK